MAAGIFLPALLSGGKLTTVHALVQETTAERLEPSFTHGALSVTLPTLVKEAGVWGTVPAGCCSFYSWASLRVNL